MKLDQETVVKHQFWFLLGGYFLLWLIAIFWMKFTFPGEIDALRTKYDAAAKGVDDAQRAGPVNTATFIPPWEQETKEFGNHKGVIWELAWRYQEGMYDWPETWAKKYNGLTNPQIQISSDDRDDYWHKLYPKQIKDLSAYAPKWLNPVELKDGFDAIFQPKTDWKETPTREEVWLAQEDYWVKRELLIVVYEAMAQQALMTSMPADEKEAMPKGVDGRYRFQNKNWEITLNLRKKGNEYIIAGDSTIKNIHPSHHPQPLTSAKGRGIWFNVAQENVRTTFEVRGEPINWNETKNFSPEDYSEPLHGIKWDKEWLKDHPVYVSQGFDQTNCPIRRVNSIELPKQDCRTFIWPLQPNHMLAQLDALPEDQDPTKKADAAAGAGGAPGGGGMPSGGGPGMAGGSSPQMMGMAMRPGGPGGPGGNAAPAGNRTPNNDIERDRYLQPANLDKKLNPPSRHLPLAIQVIVEQSHMHDMLVALANSRLRFQITQVEFSHAKDYTPQSEGDSKDKKDGGGPEAEGPRVFTGGMPSMTNDPRQMQMRMAMQMQMQRNQGPTGGDPMRGGRGSGMGMPGGMRGGPGMPPSGPMAGGPGGPPPFRSGAGGPMMGGAGMGGAGGPMMMRPPGPAMMSGGAQTRWTNAPGARPGVMPAAGVTDPKQAANQSDDNLIELTVYGIATLYRAPDAPQTTEQQATQPGAPTAQPGQQPAAPAGQPSGGVAQPAPATESGAASTQPAPTQQGGTPAKAPETQPNNASPPPANTTPPGGTSPAAPKQPEKKDDQQKTPPTPPAGKKS